jgi:hypothetical protein
MRIRPYLNEDPQYFIWCDDDTTWSHRCELPEECGCGGALTWQYAPEGEPGALWGHCQKNDRHVLVLGINQGCPALFDFEKVVH